MTTRRFMKFINLFAAFTIAGALGACSTDENTDPPAQNPGLVKLEIQPADVTLLISASQPADYLFKAMGTFSGRGMPDDISKKVNWSIMDHALGSFGADAVANKLRTSATRGGKTEIIAQSFPLAAVTATVTIVYSAALVRSDAPAKAPDLFKDATEQAALGPKLVAPSDGSMMQKATPVPFSWSPAAGTDLFELSFKNDVTDLRIYTGGTSITPSAEEWLILSTTNAGDTVDVTVRGMKAAAPANAGSATPIKIQFAP